MKIWNKIPDINIMVSCIRILLLIFLLMPQMGSAQDVSVWAVPAEQKVRPDDQIEKNNLIWSGEDKKINVVGAGNEHVPFQVVISTSNEGETSRIAAEEYQATEAMKDLFIESSNLTSDQGETIPDDQINLFLEHYILLYGKSSQVGGTGYWPDALAPIERPFSMDAEFSVVRNRPIWVDIVVPPDTPGGIYTGDLTITHNGEVIETLDLEIEVYDFSLPEETPLITYINTSRGNLANFYNKSASSEEIERLTKEYYKFLYDNRMEPWFHDLLEPEVMVNGNNVEIQFDNQEYQYYMEDLNTKRVLLDAYPSDLERQIEEKKFSETHNQIVKAYLSEVHSYFEKHGWSDRLVFNSPTDEPNTEQEYEETRKWASLVKEATGNIPFLSTESPVTQNPDWGTLRGHVDNFSVHGNALNDPKVKEVINEEQEKGGEISWYISCDQTYPQPNYFIDAPALDLVMVPWITARYNMDGILYWATNYWYDTPNPWRDPVTFNSGYFCSDGYVLNGEGSLFYPGDYTEKYTGQPDVDGPISSIRFELLREGIEDYTYLWMLKDLGDEEFAEQRIRDLVVDVSTFSRNREELYLMRKRIAKRIEELVE